MSQNTTNLFNIAQQVGFCYISDYVFLEYYNKHFRIFIGHYNEGAVINYLPIATPLTICVLSLEHYS